MVFVKDLVSDSSLVNVSVRVNEFIELLTLMTRLPKVSVVNKDIDGDVPNL